jgi:predicted nucleotidyltransferase
LFVHTDKEEYFGRAGGLDQRINIIKPKPGCIDGYSRSYEKSKIRSYGGNAADLCSERRTISKEREHREEIAETEFYQDEGIDCSKVTDVIDRILYHRDQEGEKKYGVCVKLARYFIGDEVVS